MKRRMLLLAAASLSACSVLPAQPYVQKRDWPLALRRPTALPPRRAGLVLLVRNVAAAPGLDVRGVQWLLPDGSVHVDFYEQWAVPPAQGVDDDLRRWLADTGSFAAVLPSGTRMNADLVLEAELTTLIGDPAAGVARAALALVLLDQRTGETKVLLQQTVTAEASLSGSEAPAVVQALKAALGRALQQTEELTSPMHWERVRRSRG